jgi:hypothetical protein
MWPIDTPQLMKKTLIQITGDTLDIKELKASLRTTDWKITEEADGYYLTSDILTKISDNKEIESKAKQFLDILNGACNLLHGDHKKVQTGTIIQLDENGNRHIYVSINESNKIRSRFHGDLTAKGDPAIKPTTIEQWIEKAKKHESVRDVLHFFNDITWWNLYKIYEIIRDDLIGTDLDHKKKILKTDIEEIFVKKGLSSFDKVNDFTNVAQSRDLLGDEARHASRRIKRPDVVLTLSEAHGIIKSLFEEWIKLKES